MSALGAVALVLGALLGLGLWIVVSSAPRFGRESLAHRVAPFVADMSPQAFRLSTQSRGNPATVLADALTRALGGISFLAGGGRGSEADVLRSLSQAGRAPSVTAFRAHQMLWALGGLALGVLVDLVAGLLGLLSLAGLGAVPIVGVVAGYFAAEYVLRRRAKHRRERIVSELPTVFEFASLSLAAGESITDSLRRVAQVGSGEFAGELAHVMRQVDAGVPLTTALSAVCTRLQIPAVTRGLEQILGALDRGSPLAVVLQAHAQDAREDSKRELLEKAGQKEVVMLIPLVFLILPVTILFAVFPGLLVIQAGF
jgi:tight adherence protein C